MKPMIPAEVATDAANVILEAVDIVPKFNDSISR